MKLIRASVCGYCMGVERAIKKTFQEVVSHPEKKIVTFGPLIHNPYTLAQLEQRGVHSIETPNEIVDPHNSIVIIRAHGVPPKLEKEILQTGASIIDATCPKVHLSQKMAQDYEKTGYRIIIAGEKNHSEIIGILGYAPSAMVVLDIDEALEIAHRIKETNGSTAKVVLLAQTTYSESKFAEMISSLKEILPNLEVANTICKATRERQESLYNLCKLVDAVLVIGGKKSANTQRLKAIAEEQGLPVWLIENERDLPEEIYQFDTVGLTAGASTPKELIDRIESILSK
ncbi:MAG: 4-hydroxy-3-methylbut-2-enyl diphosphate reductase [Treponema sp.]|nr:4-hydroxy-3-methylbut-2-enyl diphosphate reductase [Treponema sp.]